MSMEPSKLCEQCRKEFFKNPNTSFSSWRKSKFCSHSCAGLARRGKGSRQDAIRHSPNVCGYCKRAIRLQKNRSLRGYRALKFCSHRCASSLQRFESKQRLLSAMKGCETLEKLSKKLGLTVNSARTLCRRCDVSSLPLASRAHGTGEVAIIRWLERNGLKPKIEKYKSLYDATVNGWHVEFKSSQYSKLHRTWTINIHRHGIMNESETDYYIVRLIGIPDIPRWSVFFILKAPIKRFVVVVSLRSLVLGKVKNIGIDTLKILKKEQRDART